MALVIRPSRPLNVSPPSRSANASASSKRAKLASPKSVGAALLCIAGRRRICCKAKKLPSMLENTMGKRELKAWISWYLATHGEEKTKEMLDNMKEMGFSWATRAGISLGVDDMSVPKKKALLCDGSSQRQLDAEVRFRNGDITVVEKFLRVTEEWTRTSEKVKDEAVLDFKENNPDNPVYMMSTSGARGNISQVRQLVAMRGLMADAQGQLIDVPIKHCLREGMTVSDMLISGHGARKGVIDTALRTANSGYLYRRLDFTASPVVVRSEDCGTEEGWPLRLKRTGSEASFADRLRGRVLARGLRSLRNGRELYPKGHLLSADDAQFLAAEWEACEKEGMEVPEVTIRSPLTCQEFGGICAKCYGEDLSTGRLVEVGHPSGIIAAQSMGEPGTQLTMRTFHTGGAYEGTAGEGIVAEVAGKVSLKCGQEIIRDIAEEHTAVAEWKRSPQGDVGCVLAKDCVLEVHGDGRSVKMDLEKGCYVKALDGQEVSFGQVLYEKPAKQTGGRSDELDVLNKQIQSGASGEVLIEAADAKSSCINEGGQLVWVLQGSCFDLQQGKDCSLAVQKGDVLAAKQAVAQEWAKTKQRGVPRFQEPPRRALSKEALCLRTDFDSWELPATRCTEYVARGKVPSALEEDYHGKLPGVRPMFQQGVARAFAAAAEIRQKKEEAPETVKVFTQVTDESVRTFCNAPSLGTGSVLSPTCRELKTKHLAPSGGLVLHTSYKGGTTVLWSPETVRSSADGPHFRRSGGGYEVVTEKNGTVVRKSLDRVYSKKTETEAWESVKEGEIFFAQSKYFQQGKWWEAADDGVHFFQRAVPPNKPICDELLSTKNHKDWILVEILDDPRDGPNVRVLLRKTRSIHLPKASLPMPSESQEVRFWSLPNENGEIVESTAPIVLAHELLASLGRSATDLHCTTAVPTGRLAHTEQPRCGASGTPLEQSSVWMPGDLCVVQHTPLGPARAAASGEWRSVEPRHERPSLDSQLIPRRALPSKTSGIVSRAQLSDSKDSRRLTVVVLNGEDVLEVPCSAMPSCRVGQLLRQNDALSAADRAPQPGQVLSIQEREDDFVVLLRKACAYLVTNKGNVQVKSGSVVQMGDTIATEPQVVPRTSDIVQGLPRIDRLFEAAGNQHQDRIDEIFAEERQKSSGLEAALRARLRFATELVTEIQSAYGEQGVDIKNKHIEVVVRRMAEKCEIVKGTSNLPPGTTLLYSDLEALCALQPSGEVEVRPLVMGLTKVGRDNSHVLMAMGFREVDNVLNNAVLKGTGRYVMDGVKENLMIGKAVSVGSGINAKPTEPNIRLDKIPMKQTKRATLRGPVAS